MANALLGEGEKDVIGHNHMVHQGDFRRHPDKADMRAVILSRSYAVEKLIICPT